jgi:hypothetical protein
MKRKTPSKNSKAQWAAYKDLQKQVDRAWKTMKSHVNRRASAWQIAHDKNRLVLLLGECNYMVRELKRLERKFG